VRSHVRMLTLAATVVAAFMFAQTVCAAVPDQQGASGEAISETKNNPDGSNAGPDKKKTKDGDQADQKGKKEATTSRDDRDLVISAVEPDFTIVTLPTTLRLPRYRGEFRFTHRFTAPLDEGGFGTQLGNLFGLDSAAAVGLEFRFGIARGTQVAVHRTNVDKTIQFLGQYDVVQQGDRLPFSLDALVSIEGRNNFKEDYAPALGAVLSHEFTDRVALYLEPIWVSNTNPTPALPTDHTNTAFVGIGGRFRFSPTAYVVAEVSPRVAGYRPGTTHYDFGIEKRVGGHVFQLNFSDSFGTTLAQIARGGTSPRHWYLGFNITRKFY
jgi:hypothetical protein